VDPSSTPWRVVDAPSSQPGPPDLTPDAAEQPSRPVLLAAVALIAVLAMAAVAVGTGALTGMLGGATAGSVVIDTAASDAPVGELVVDVTGAVSEPGVYRLPAGSRVGDAISAAGGYGPRVDATRTSAELNLAAPLADGEQVVVPSRDDPAPGGAAPESAPGSVAGSGGGSNDLVDLNTATQGELEALPGIGPVTASKIIDARAVAPFASVDDLRSRKLVGQKTFEALRDLVTVR
jgi:competence protein ComEA